MKLRALFILLALVAFAPTAFSQSVRWRFTIPTPAYQKDFTQVSSVANDGSGGAVFVAVDYRFYEPEAGISGWETVGNRIFWLDRTGALLYTLTIEGDERVPKPFPLVLTRSVLHLQLLNDTGAVTGIRRVTKARKGVTVTDFVPPADETVAPGSAFNTADSDGYFTFKKTGESVVQIVRYRP